ncbi:MAG: glycosyltransferase [Dehalococcoidia bacterium]
MSAGGGGGGVRPLRVFTWHVHGTYLYYLAQSRHEFFLPVKPGLPEGYSGRSGHFPWPDNMHEVDAADVRCMEFDCVLFQSRRNYLLDQHEVLSEQQRMLPRVYLEHDPPREHPTDTQHIVDDPGVLLVHVTPFNALMWDSGRTPVRVVEHGVPEVDGARYTGELERGIVVVNNIQTRGRRTGYDIFQEARKQVPLDLAGMGSEALGGLGDIPHGELLRVMSRYRFFFNPIRYTSLGLAVCEAMSLGMPIVGLATAEMPTVIENDVSGYVDTDVDRLVHRMQLLLAKPARAQELGNAARQTAMQRFNIRRFTRDWDSVLWSAASREFALRPAPRRQVA